MGVVVAHGTVDLAQVFDGVDLLQLALQTVGHVGHLLAHGARRSGLTMGAAQHRLVGVCTTQRRDGISHLLHLVARNFNAMTQHQRVRQVVDVFGGAGKVNKFVDRHQLGIVGDLLLDEVLNRFHVVVGGTFDLLDPLGMLDTEVVDQAVQQGVGFCTQGRHFLDLRMGSQLLQPADLDLYAETDQTEFTEYSTQVSSFAAVAAINRGYGGKGRKLHVTQSHLSACVIKGAIIRKMAATGYAVARVEPPLRSGNA